MSIRYEITIEDLVAMSRYVFLHAEGMRRQRSRFRWALTATVVLGSLTIALSYSDPTTQLAAISAGLVIAALLFATADRLFLWFTELHVRRLQKEGGQKGILGSHQMEIVDDGFVRRSAVSETHQKWVGVERFVETDSHAFLFVGATTAHVVAKHAITEGDVEAFLHRAKQLWLAANPEQASSAL